MLKHKIQYNYDEKYDILYIIFSKNEPSIACEKDGFLIRRSIKNGKFTGITIFDFKTKQKNNNFLKMSKFIDVDLLNQLKI